jgi:hypothetical protein
MVKALSLVGRTLRRVGERLLARGLVIGQEQDLHYHPLSPWEEGVGRPIDRSEGSYSRLEAINEILRSEAPMPRIALDVGSHIGFFALNLARQGMLVHAIESNRDRLLLSFLLAQEKKVRLAPIPLHVDRTTVELLPESDITLCLSVWHHWVRRYGVKDATYILQEIVNKTRRLVFFDSGEEEMPSSYGLPYGEESAQAYFSRYLPGLDGVAVSLDLGRHQAIAPADTAGARHKVLRTLYCLRKAPRAAP